MQGGISTGGRAGNGELQVFIRKLNDEDLINVFGQWSDMTIAEKYNENKKKEERNQRQEDQ